MSLNSTESTPPQTESLADSSAIPEHPEDETNGVPLSAESNASSSPSAAPPQQADYTTRMKQPSTAATPQVAMEEPQQSSESRFSTSSATVATQQPTPSSPRNSTVAPPNRTESSFDVPSDEEDEDARADPSTVAVSAAAPRPTPSPHPLPALDPLYRIEASASNTYMHSEEEEDMRPPSAVLPLPMATAAAPGPKRSSRHSPTLAPPNQTESCSDTAMPSEEQDNRGSPSAVPPSESNASSSSSSSTSTPLPVLTLTKHSKNKRRRRKASALHLTPNPSLRHSSYSHDHEYLTNVPDFGYFSKLLAALLLTTGLGLIAALDAKKQCLKHETYVLLELVDDDNFQKAFAKAARDESGTCLFLFHQILVPVTILMSICGILSLCLLRRHRRREQRNVVIPQYTVSHLAVLVRLLVAVSGILAAQTYSIMAIMLQPRVHSQSDNPYQSLGAVDVYGHVGDNANLFYLSWLSEGLALALVYQVATATVQQWREEPQQQLLPATSWVDFKESRAAWYQSLYKLRVRTGIWFACLISSLVLVSSCQYVWNVLLWPQSSNSDSRWSVREVCDGSNYHKWSSEFCHRTAAGWISGVVAVVLSVTAIGIHLSARRRKIVDHEDPSSTISTRRWPYRPRYSLALQAELVLSVLLSVLLGFTAVFLTGVQGPAASVGNLYYAIWLSFLLCVRISLGCLEEYHDIPESTSHSHRNASRHSATTSAYEAPSYHQAQQQQTSNGVVLPPTGYEEEFKQDPVPSHDGSEQSYHDPLEKDRAKRLRSYFFLGIFSIVCAASSYDAASNQVDALSPAQKYMMWAPLIVSIQSAVLFVLCLTTTGYLLASHFCCGGVLSMLSFALWLGDLVLTMHSEDSWSVNGIGEIEMANLYYFSWASILTAGLQMMSYVKALFRVKKTDHMVVVWIAICKVCFVILGAATHVWHTIAGNCDFDEITSSAVTYCSRTVLSMVFALTGMLVGGLVAAGRLLLMACPACRCPRLQAHVEMLISMFLVFLFGAAVALITGIGGPGQSVGDMFYSTWLAFFVSIGIFVTCYDEIKRDELADGNDRKLDNGVETEVAKGVLV